MQPNPGQHRTQHLQAIKFARWVVSKPVPELVSTLTATENIVAWVTAIAMIILSLVLAYTEIFQGTPSGWLPHRTLRHCASVEAYVNFAA
jgi:hypothetical protein